MSYNEYISEKSTLVLLNMLFISTSKISLILVEKKCISILYLVGIIGFFAQNKTKFSLLIISK